MKALKCELCGSTEVIKEDNLYRCSHCNTKYTVAEAAKLLTEIKIDRSDEYSNYLILARRAKQENNVKDANKYYEMVLKIEPNNWEAMFYYAYFSAIDTRLFDVENSMQKMINTTASVLRVINKMSDNEEIKEIVSEISDSIKTLGLFFFSVSKEHYKEYKNVSSAGDEFTDRGISVFGMEVSIGLLVEEHIIDETTKKTIVPDLFECSIEVLKDTFNTRWDGNVTPRANELYEDQAISIAKKIQQYKPNYGHPNLSRKFQGNSNADGSVKKEGCYIATSVYGNYNHPKVVVLRRFRDKTLKSSFIGRKLVAFYYKISPSIVKAFGSHSSFTKPVRYLLDIFTDYLEGGCSAHRTKR